MTEDSMPIQGLLWKYDFVIVRVAPWGPPLRLGEIAIPAGSVGTVLEGPSAGDRYLVRFLLTGDLVVKAMIPRDQLEPARRPDGRTMRNNGMESYDSTVRLAVYVLLVGAALIAVLIALRWSGVPIP